MQLSRFNVCFFARLALRERSCACHRPTSFRKIPFAVAEATRYVRVGTGFADDVWRGLDALDFLQTTAREAV